jgi:hypothetical protein
MMSALKFAKALPASTFARSAAQRAYSAAATGEVIPCSLSLSFFPSFFWLFTTFVKRIQEREERKSAERCKKRTRERE